MLNMLATTMRARTLLFSRLYSSASSAVEVTPERRLAVPLAFSKVEAKIEAPQGAKKLPPIIMIHGTLASSNTYRSLAKRPDFGKREADRAFYLICPSF